MTTTPPELRVGGPGGRAPSTGRFLKAFLLENRQGYPAQIHRAYVKIFSAMTTRKGRPYHLATYQSFLQYLHRVKRLSLIELAREESTPRWDPATGVGWRGSKPGAPRRYYRLTHKGRLEEQAWEDPNRVYRISRRPPVAVPRPIAPAPPRIAPPAPPTAIPPFGLADRPGRRAAQQLVAHLRRLEDLDVDTPEVDQEVERLEGDLQGWLDQVEEAISREEEKEEPNEDRLERLQEQRDALEEAVSALGDRDIGLAIDALDRAFPTGAPRTTPPAPPVRPRRRLTLGPPA